MTLPARLTQSEAIKVIEAAMPKDALAALRASPDGVASIAITVDIMVDQSARCERMAQSRHLVLRTSDSSADDIARGALPATTTIRVYRTKPDVGLTIVIPAGTLVVSDDGHLFSTDTDVTFGGAEFAPKNVDVTALFAGYAPTTIAGGINNFADIGSEAEGDICSVDASVSPAILSRGAGDLFLAGFVGMYVRLFDGANAGVVCRITTAAATGESASIVPVLGVIVSETSTASWELLEWSDLGFRCEQPDDCAQGYDGSLDFLASESGRFRTSGESDDSLRLSLRQSPDAVSVAAIRRACNRIAGSLGPVSIYQIGAVGADADEGKGFPAFPGVILGLTPLGVSTEVVTPTGPVPPPAGLAVLGDKSPFFLVRWDNYSEGETGPYLSPLSPGEFPPIGPAGPIPFTLDSSPLGGGPFLSNVLRAAMAKEVNRIKGAGVRWLFYPRGDFL
jgi:hypothetical protein